MISDIDYYGISDASLAAQRDESTWKIEIVGGK